MNIISEFNQHPTAHMHLGAYFDQSLERQWMTSIHALALSIRFRPWGTDLDFKGPLAFVNLVGKQGWSSQLLFYNIG